MKRAEGVVTKIVSNLYTVFADGDYREAVARGRLKLNPRSVTVGDRVVLSDENGTNVIDSVLPRKNELQRPFVANVDTAFIVIAKEPKPDLLLTDKIIVNCFKEGVTPVLVYNKCELAEDGEIDALKRAYSFIDVIAVSAKLKSGLRELESEVDGKTVCLAGQSAVGKTSLMNAVLDLDLKTDGLSAKIKRGKNTTRHVEIYPALGGHVMDTCGFSMLTLVNIPSDELKYYYEDFLKFADDCKYTACNHISEPGCAVKEAVAAGKLDKGRYDRYLQIYNELIESEKHRY